MSLQSTAVQVAQPASLPRLLTLSLANCSFPKMFRMAEFFGGCRYGFLPSRPDFFDDRAAGYHSSTKISITDCNCFTRFLHRCHATHLTISQELD
jgi:hypothetical protein